MHDTLDCLEAIAWVQDYLKHELPPERTAELRAHLERCPPCFRYVRFEQRFLEMLERPAQRCTCPEALRARIEHELGREMEQS